MPGISSRAFWWAFNNMCYQPCRFLFYCISFFGLRRINANDTSWWEEKFIKRKNQLRNLFVPNNRPIRIFPCHSGHTHPRSAEFRSSANDYLVETAELSGYTPYVVSRANRDRGDGARLFYHEKDYHVPYRCDPIKHDHALIFTDVDYYADMNRWLQHFLPIMMYTLVPKQLTYRGGEFSYYVNSAGWLDYHVKGGANYQHPLWQYKGDTVSVMDWYGGINIFDIEQREIFGDEHHRFIWLLPKARISMLGWIFNPSWYGKILGLKRLQVLSGSVDYLWDAVTDFLSVREAGSKYSVELDGELFYAIKERLSNKKDPPVTSDIERMLTTAKIPQEKAVRMAPLLLNCWDFSDFRPNILSTGSFSTNFCALPRSGALATEDGKMVGRAVTPPIVTKPAMFAAKGYNADLECIAGRVNGPRNLVVPGKDYFEYAREFVRLVVPDSVAGTGVPKSCSEVDKLQSKPMQRSRFQQVAHTMSSMCDNKLKAFIKTESYACPNSPRNITTCSPELTINFSRYTLVLSEYLKKFDWYGIGKSPRKVIKRIRALASELAAVYGLVPQDYGRFDGSVPKFLQEHITLAIGLRFFGEAHRVSYKQYHDSVFKKNAVTAEGVRYDAGTGTRSGSPQTSMNTLKASFISYCALRKLGFTPIEAFQKLGIHAGDDGVETNHRSLDEANDVARMLPLVAKDLGLKLESTTVVMNNPVPYCGRYFANPWFSDETFQDPMRTMAKLHLTASAGLTVEQSAANRAHGYISTDRITPIIGTYAKRCLELSGDLRFKGGNSEEQYKCSNSWPQHDRETILTAMASVLGLTTDEILMKDQIISEVMGLDQFPVLFESQSTTAKCLAVVDGEIVGMDQHNTQQNRFENDAKPKTSSGVVEPGGTEISASARDILGKHCGSTGAQKDCAKQRGTNSTRVTGRCGNDGRNNNSGPRPASYATAARGVPTTGKNNTPRPRRQRVLGRLGTTPRGEAPSKRPTQ